MKTMTRRLTSGFYAVWVERNDGSIALLDASRRDVKEAEQLARQYLREHGDKAEKSGRRSG